MTNKKFWLGLLVLALVFGMLVVGCKDDSTDSANGNFGNGQNDGEKPIGGGGGDEGDYDDPYAQYPTSLNGTLYSANNGDTIYSLKFTSSNTVAEAYLVDGTWSAWFALDLPKTYSYSYFYGQGTIKTSTASYDFTVSNDGNTLIWARPNTSVDKLTYHKQSISSSTGTIKINNTSGKRIDTIYIVNSTNLDVHYKNNGGMVVDTGTTFSSVPVGTYYVYVAGGYNQGAKTGVSVSSGQTTTLTFNGSSVQ